MRGSVVVLVAATAAVAMSVSARAADYGYNAWPGPRVIQVGPATPSGAPDVLVERHLIRTVPTQILDPSDARPPVYIVNQGPWYGHRGFGPYGYYGWDWGWAYAVPTYSEGGYAYVGAYPYRGDGFYGYRSYGSAGPEQVNGRTVYQLGYRPYSSYDYRPAPSARVIEIAPATPTTPAAPATPQRPAR